MHIPLANFHTTPCTRVCTRALHRGVDTGDWFTYIPQHGSGTASLNVAVAASIVLYQFATWAKYAEAPRTNDKYDLAPRPQRQRGKKTLPASTPEEIRQARQQKRQKAAAEAAAEAAVEAAAGVGAGAGAGEGAAAVEVDGSGSGGGDTNVAAAGVAAAGVTGSGGGGGAGGGRAGGGSA